MKTFLALAIILSLVVACTASPTGAKLGEGDRGRTVTVPSKSFITLTLPSNPTTGYKWTFLLQPDQSFLKLVSSTYNPPTQQIPGAGGTETWVFQTTGTGTTEVKLSYIRPSAPQDNPKEFAFTVVVK